MIAAIWFSAAAMFLGATWLTPKDERVVTAVVLGFLIPICATVATGVYLESSP